MITPWQVEFLGGLRIYRKGQPAVCRLRTTKTTALLAFLCAHVGRDQGREELVDRFWPDLPVEAGRNSLRIALSALRRVFESPDATESTQSVLRTNRSHVCLAVGAVETDVAALEEALRRGDRTRAAALAAQGPYLPGLYDEWVLAERERVEILREQALDESDVSGEGGKVEKREVPQPTAPTRAMPGSVPLPLGRFFGRETELAHLYGLLADPGVRLITITGPGGTGKTRLALEAARALREGKSFLQPGRLRGGVWFVPLVAVTQGSRMLPEICRAVGADFAGNGDALEILAAHLQALGGRTILLLDNLEQVEADGCALALLRLLERVPDVTCLATSRRRVSLVGERVLALPSFPTPTLDDSLATLERHPAVALFVDRAREADVDFVLTSRRAAEVVALCERLNGLPLALEMAASWAGIYTPAEMVVKAADSGGDALPGRHAGRESRHRSLRAVAEWSTRLLPTEARQLLAALSVFQGRWIQEAGAAVAPDEFTAERLALLCDHSLVRSETSEREDAPPTRYFQIVPALLPFARELLAEKPEEVNATRHRHARYFTDFAHAATRAELDFLPDTREALAFLEVSSSDSACRNELLRLLGGMWSYWWRFGQWDEAQNIADRVLGDGADDASPEIEGLSLSAALRCAGKLAFYRSDFVTARRFMDRRRVVEERLGREAEVIQLRANAATIDVELGRFDEARQEFEAILPLLTILGPRWETESGYIFNNYGDVLLALGRIEDARRMTESHLQMLERSGVQKSGIAGLCWERLALLHRASGELDAARDCAEKSLAIFRYCREIFRVADVLLLLSAIAREDGDRSGALEALRESFVLRRKVPSDDGFRRSVAEAEKLLVDRGSIEAMPSAEALTPVSARDAFDAIGKRLDSLDVL